MSVEIELTSFSGVLSYFFLLLVLFLETKLGVLALKDFAEEVGQISAINFVFHDKKKGTFFLASIVYLK